MRAPRPPQPRVTALLLSPFTPPAGARERPPVGPQAGWSPAAAKGAPDATKHADDPRAWATLAADAGAEWLELGYDRAVEVGEVRIHQTFNPGAVRRVEAFDDSGKAVELWSGVDKARGVELKIEPAKTVRTQRLRIHLDTTRISGWNEIDAVALVGKDLTLQWAISARASSTYATASAGPLGPLVGQKVRVEHLKGSVTGVLKGMHGELIEIEGADGRTVFVGSGALVTLEPLER
ncbi:MAG: hypothetical protein H6704_03890 [Myxococcales bacterium]|nr:hypothetical protein [Myxococcales bacterium]